jgi:hypothetical protein
LPAQQAKPSAWSQETWMTGAAGSIGVRWPRLVSIQPSPWRSQYSGGSAPVASM